MILLYYAKHLVLTCIFSLLIGGTGSDSFFIRQVSSNYLEALVQITDSPSYLKNALESNDLEQKTRCKRIFYKHTNDLFYEVQYIKISTVRKKNIRYWNNYIKFEWHTKYGPWSEMTYNEQSQQELDLERGRAFFCMLIEQGCGRQDLNYLYKTCTKP